MARPVSWLVWYPLAQMPRRAGRACPLGEESLGGKHKMHTTTHGRSSSDLSPSPRPHLSLSLSTTYEGLLIRFLASGLGLAGVSNDVGGPRKQNAPGRDADVFYSVIR